MRKDGYARDEVLFAASSDQIQSNGRHQDCLVIVPGRDCRRVDGGYLVDVQICAVGHFSEVDAQVPGKLFLLADEYRSEGPLELEPSSLAAWASEYKQLQTVDEFVDKFGDFVLSLANRDAYREIAYRLADAARRLLVKAHDIAVLNAYHPKSKSLTRARTFATFRSILLKSDEEIFAFVAIRSLLDVRSVRSPLNAAAFIEADVPISSDFDLPVSFYFGEALHALNPINVIIGSNGQGKTRLLLGIADAVEADKLAIRGGVGDELSQSRSLKIVAFTYEPSHWARHKRHGVEVESMGLDSVSWRRVTWLIHQIASTEQGQDNLRQIEEIISQFVIMDEIYVPLIAREAGGKKIISLHDFIEG